MKRLLLAAVLAAVALALPPQDRFTFAILGDRTGEAQPGVYDQIWKETAAERPAFVVTTGDSIQGLDDAKLGAEWRQMSSFWTKFRSIPLYLTPGNHDIWSAESERLYVQYSHHPVRYSFDYHQAHVVILDNSRADQLSDDDMSFLEADLKAHAATPVKFIFMHRPSWIVSAAFGNPDFPLHQLAKQYGVQYVIAGHVHQLLRFNVQGITYLSMPSSGGHLRLSKAYDDGWFFGHAKVDVTGRDIGFAIEEAKAPIGQGRASKPADWGALGLVKR